MNSKFKSSLFTIIATACLAPTLSMAGHDEAMSAYDAGQYSVAAKEFEASAMKGNIRSMTILASMYEQGKGVKQNLQSAAFFYKLAAYKGDANSVRKLKYLEDSGKVTVSQSN